MIIIFAKKDKSQLTLYQLTGTIFTYPKSINVIIDQKELWIFSKNVKMIIQKLNYLVSEKTDIYENLKKNLKIH